MHVYYSTYNIINSRVHGITLRSGVQLPKIQMKKFEEEETLGEGVVGEEENRKVVDQPEKPLDPESHTKRAPTPVKAYIPPIPYLQRVRSIS